MSTARPPLPVVLPVSTAEVVPSVVGIVAYRGLYFNVYDSLMLSSSVLLRDPSSFSFLRCWGATISAGLASFLS
ncbi:hypothetical protein FA13DRAFT_1804353 [Coprinellus micaceus]|uniref:Uncharacterized protein n=1 Tax=Coprinellus micaceus TaxID=71717 RepID=A0A4Y7S8F4_COPMI|nr:hypothetical protein FA13DRAFT_1804353 [Coprinellus micaceus]